ncbi:MAG: DUF1565 domain-containing protein [Clostridiales bacterium]|nr:DUF1565 domain-containing protein [Clostridiales bacterium]
MSRVYYVSTAGSDLNDGSKTRPFRTISKAAEAADAGDRVVVSGGEYREWVKPRNGGTSDICRIVYEAAPGERPVIKGSERIVCWELVSGTVWKAELPNTFFGDYNPFAEELSGDWLIWPVEYRVHAGDVYINGRSLYEAASLEDVLNPTMRTVGVAPPWTLIDEPLPEPERTLYCWYSEVEESKTVIYANFQGLDPNAELTEINVRKCCFYPEKAGLNYITLRGFEIAQAACPWAPPTADQPGMVGAHWSKGWIIEDNILHDAKCSAISLGKEASTGHNLRTLGNRKPGYQYQMEAVFLALQSGWSKEKIGSHIVRNNVIYDCGQNGIVGHMGAAFSRIYNNHIYNIGVKHEFFGYEIAGIKLHAAIDVQITRNHIHNCTLGTWLDWQAQGTRVSQNIYNDNDRDLMIEVTHGPCLVDNNILASKYSYDNCAQGTAFAHNLVCGIMRRITVLDRATPYHFPHSTQVAGAAIVYGGDDRFFQNIFVGTRPIIPDESTCGTCSYDGSPVSLEEYKDLIISQGIGDHDIFNNTKQPVYINRNAYLNGAVPFDREEQKVVIDYDPGVRIVREDECVYLEMTVDKAVLEADSEIIDSEKLGEVRIVGAAYETPEGGKITLDFDLTGAYRSDKPVLGPIEGLKEGRNRIKLLG